MKFAALSALLLAICCSAAEPPTSDVWKQYLEQKKTGGPTWLPDYSYAGYKRGEASIRPTGKRFTVTDFGALPDDLKDDLDGIAKAIKAAEANGGGIVFFPKGRYLVNTAMDKRASIEIASDNIILKGEGSTKGGTVIHSIHPYGGGDPHRLQRLHLGQNVLLIHSKHEETAIGEKTVLCSIAADSPRETFSVTVDDTAKLKAGDRVYLYAMNRQIFDEMIQPYEVEEKWTTITQNKRAYAAEIHQIKAIDGNRVVFHEPIRYDIKQQHNWVLKENKPISGVGIEDICFMGNAYHRYKHHRSGMDDSGWSFIKMKGVADSWVRRCTFINCSQTVYIALSSSVSILNVIVAGNQGHHIPRAVFFNYGVLGGLILDRAGYDHGPSLSWGTVSTVFWRCTSNGSIDCHAGRPYANLFDNVAGGRINSSGGLRDYPQHLRFLTLWNFNHMVDETIEYDFWKQGKNNRFVKPIIVGFHGRETNFVEDRLEVLESLGQRVKPDSLYEAQLALRLGTLPDWVDEAKRDYANLIKQDLPAYYDKNSRDSPAFLYPETFLVSDMLDYLTSLSLQMFKSVQFTYSVDAQNLMLHTDQGLVRNTLYSLMNAIYSRTRHNNTILARAETRNGKPYVCFRIKSGRFQKPVDDINHDVDVRDAKTYAALIGGTVRPVNTEGNLEFELSLPANSL